MEMISWSCIKLNDTVRISGVTEEGHSFVSTEITDAKVSKGHKLHVKTNFGRYEIDLNSSHCNNTIIQHYSDASNYTEAKALCRYAIYNAVINSLDSNTKEALHAAFSVIESEGIGSEKEFMRYAQSRLSARSAKFNRFKLANNHFCVTLVEEQGVVKIAEIVKCTNLTRSKDNLYKTVNPIKCNYDGAGNVDVTLADKVSFSIVGGNLKCENSQITFINKTGQNLHLAQKTRIFNA